MTDRIAPTRYYVDGATLIGRQKGSPEERIPLATLPDNLAIEGYVTLRSRGNSHEDIISSKAIPDRSLPSTGAARVTEDSKWRGAIAHAVAEEEKGKPGLIGVSREDKATAIADGMTYAENLSRQDVRDYQSNSSVMTWYARLYGEKTTIRRPAMQEAAD